MFTVNSNTLSLNIGNVYNTINRQISDVSEQIASGKRVLSAKNDPAGIAQISQLKAQYSSYGVVRNNLTFGTSLLETASSSLNSVNSTLEEMRKLAVQAAGDNISTEQRAALQAQFAEYQAQIDDTVDQSTVFGKNLVKLAPDTVQIQSGINAGEQLTVTGVASDAASLGVDAVSISLSSSANAATAITDIDAAMTTISTNQATLGAQLNRVDIIDNNVAQTMKNLDASRSRIEDANIPELTTKLSLLQSQQQLSAAMLGLANSFPQSLLTLLR